ncbi:phosphomannomutase [Palleronia aestuarii]|uniref:Phosphomannomutase n=1 Tax=Palleronia aestuarii TaxID=568105 RepID=A0A2W7PVC9_9RHOB|nr:phosphomannomutase [Palleronia aestuarii]PZX13479.1 phosphomannomutase [Palleronia aestuarii]
MPVADTPSERPKFGTSGLRGLVTQLTDELVAAHVRAFAGACATGGRLFVGRDLRASSPHIAAVVAAAGRTAGLTVTDLGALPTPALALAAAKGEGGAVMVTGSHIPDDRNGLKFYTLLGEITKADEAAIAAAVAAAAPAPPADPNEDTKGVPGDGAAPYRDRYVTAFGTQALAGMTIGLYEHSTVARDLLAEILEGLGAGVVRLGRSETFLPVDTEAVSAEMREELRAWAAAHDLDAIVSADGDGDRPLLADADGEVVPGDVLGLLAARAIGAEVVVTPVSSSTAIEASGAFGQVVRTRIGSPHVIEGIVAAGPEARVAGFEANGGFLLGFSADLPGGPLTPLLTRDAALPLLAALVAAREAGVAATVAALPARHRAADRLTGIDMGAAAALLARLDEDGVAREEFLGTAVTEIDRTDGLRMTLGDGRIVHLRPSGNAPELRCYGEAESMAAAEALVEGTLARVSDRL